MRGDRLEGGQNFGTQRAPWRERSGGIRVDPDEPQSNAQIGSLNSDGGLRSWRDRRSD